MLFALLEVIQCPKRRFMLSAHTPVAMRARLGRVFLSVAHDRVLAKSAMALLCRQPISEAHAQLLHPFKTRRMPAAKSALRRRSRRLRGEPAHSARRRLMVPVRADGIRDESDTARHDPVEAKRGSSNTSSTNSSMA